ncbi:MAG TPA: DUF1440 domain-containing protein [Reyranella sp.]|jgi:hypothetical protein
MARQTPIGAVTRGMLAGIAGSFVQNLFFSATERIKPEPVKGAFRPPEPEQREETATQTVARRAVEDLMQHRKLSADKKKRAAHIVHYAFGGAWGAAYGLLAGSTRRAATLPGGLAFGTVVWEASDNGLLPAFRLAGKPARYPLKTHAYAVAAHLVYGATVWAAFTALGGRRD